MKILTLGVIALLGAGLISGQAAGANIGIVTLKPGETQTVDISATGRNTRVHNDFFSSAEIAAGLSVMADDVL
jgi:hypothetical protein